MVQSARKLPDPAASRSDAPKDIEHWMHYIHDVSLFQDIKDQPEALDHLARIMELRTFEPGAAIINEGETGDELFMLVEGDAAVYKSTSEGDQYKVVILKDTQHAFFGEGGLLDSDSRSATIRAETRCKCLVLNSRVFGEFSRAYPQWALPILSRIARAVLARLRKTNNDLLLIYNALVAEIRGG